ncbi:MAG TPA: AfsR/SARP family transcriptional regulator, partial [Streptomyces sp.]|nr:AfsR/SARP family transcriptional regulator [Streptomyces sp.]
EICRRLDGIPLALELAATRVRALGVRELADRLGDRFRLLSGGGHRGAPPRQQTLRAMIDWSWELLTAPERIVLRRLAVHHDGCTPEAAEAVCAGDGVARDEVLDLLVRLVDRSLAVMVEGPQGPRYRLLESVAAYATERLHEMEDLTLVRQRHLAHYLELADRARPRLHGPDQSHWLHRLDAETGNLRAALDHAVAPRNSPGAYEAHRLVTSLSWYWLLRGRLREAHRALEAALRATPDGPGSPGRPAGPSRSDGPDGGTDPAAAEAYTLRNAFALLVGDPRPAPVERDIAATGRITDTGRRARAQWLLAHAHFNAGNVAASEQLTALALAGFRALDDRWGVGLALGSRAIHALIRGDLAVIRRDGEESVRTLRELGDRWGELQSVSPLAALAEISGDYARAARLHRDGLRLAEELGLTAEVSARLSGLGRLALLDRDWPRARELHEKARRLAVEQGYKFGEIYAELGLALGARREGDPVAAEAYLVRIRDWYAEVSSEAGNTLVLAELGFVAEQRGDHRAARALHLEALAVAHEVGDLRALALALEGLAGAEALAGRPAAAALLLGAATAAREAAGAPLPPAERGDVDRIGSAVRGAVGEAAFTEAFVRGRKLTPDEAAAATAGAGAGSAETR